MIYKFDNWFPMDDFPKQGVTGAYTWMIGKGYGNEINAIKTSPEMPKKNYRRLPLVALIYEKSLISGFLTSCWTQGNRSLIERLRRMDYWHGKSKNDLALVKWMDKNF
jgi:hypothetical protein